MTETETFDELVFYVNGVRVSEKEPKPKKTLLQYLRTCMRLTGTKEACGQGGCGACTVMLSKLDTVHNKINHFSVNSCLVPLCSLHGVAVTTVEGVGSTRQGLHILQKRLADSHGLQCGFCTPGIVMTMYTLLRNNPHPPQQEIEQALEGNLCRCTGYRAILDAFTPFSEDCCVYGEMCCKKQGGATCPTSLEEMQPVTLKDDDKTLNSSREETQDPIFPSELQLSKRFGLRTIQFCSDGLTWVRPVTLAEVLRLKSKCPDAVIVMGNTAVGYLLKTGIIKTTTVICATDVQEMHIIDQSDAGLTVGAALTLTKLEIVVKDAIKCLPEHQSRNLSALTLMLRRYGVAQLKNLATLGGSIMSAKSNADLNPLFVAMGAEVTVASASSTEQRKVKMDEKFFIGPGQTVLAKDEVLVSVTLPYSLKDDYIEAFKQSDRRAFDMATVNAAMFVRFEDEKTTVKDLRLCFGGVAPTTFVATNTMRKCAGLQWTHDVLSLMTDHLLEELSDTNKTGLQHYRLCLVCGFLLKFYYAICQKLSIQVICTEASAIRSLPHPPCEGTQDYELVQADQPDYDAVGKPMPHVSGYPVVTGEANFTDDVPKYQDELFLAPVISKRAHARIISVDASQALTVPTVVDFVDHRDVPGSNTYGLVTPEEELFATKEVTYYGQIIGGIVARSRDAARKAASLVAVEYEDLPSVLSIKDAVQQRSFFEGSMEVETGDMKRGFQESNHVIEDEFSMSGQEHFYMETQSALAAPKNEHGEMDVISSCQALQYCQSTIAEFLGVPRNRINCRVKRLGGGFGGKMEQPVLASGPAAVAAYKLRVPVRCVLARDEDMMMTGKRHAVLSQYKVAFTQDGKITALELKLYANAGHKKGVSGGFLDKLLHNILSAYYISNIRVSGYACRTNLPSSCPMRGFGQLPGAMVMEQILYAVSCCLGKSLKEVQDCNLYGQGDLTLYNLPLADNNLRRCWSECLAQSKYDERTKAVDEYNRKNKWKKRGIVMMPMKYRIGMVPVGLNQGCVLVHIYTDGSVLVSHGGSEMGQGIHTKMIQVASRALGISVENIFISETSTSCVPNAAWTGASVGSDLYGHAVMDACNTLRERLAIYRQQNPAGKWVDWVSAAYMDRVSLSATGFSKPGNDDTEYYAFGAACTEVEIDCLTGESQVLGTDIVSDVGQSLNPAIDVGQIEGGFVQGLGLVTMEELRYSTTGQPLTRGPLQYKIPTIKDVPRKLKVSLLRDTRNEDKFALYSSKGIGETGSVMAISALLAIKEAVRAATMDAGQTGNFRFDSPATARSIRLACGDKLVEKCSSKGTQSEDFIVF